MLLLEQLLCIHSFIHSGGGIYIEAQAVKKGAYSAGVSVHCSAALHGLVHMTPRKAIQLYRISAHCMLHSSARQTLVFQANLRVKEVDDRIMSHAVQNSVFGLQLYICQTL